jgi:transmembrane sensor
LNPNQKVIYKEDEKQFEATLVNKPVPVVREGVVMDTSANVFRFRDVPLSAVMKKLEDIYGIQIECGDDTIVRSLFTGDISSCDLYCKLDIICESQNATYQIVGTKILIRGKDSN